MNLLHAECRSKPRFCFSPISHHICEVLTYSHLLSPTHAVPVQACARPWCHGFCQPPAIAGRDPPLCLSLCKHYRGTSLPAGVGCGMPCLWGCAGVPNKTVLINKPKLFITCSRGVTGNSHINHKPFIQTQGFKTTLETLCFILWLVKQKLLFGAWEEWLCLLFAALSVG